MPILPQEPDTFPEDLLSPTRLEELAEGRWWALYTLPRREKELVRRLRRMGVWHYCPLVCRRYRSPSGRARSVWTPLFPGYVFLAGTEMDRYQAMTTQCVSRSLEVPDEVELIHDLRQIQRLIASGMALTPEAQLEAGHRVRIRSGALAGLEGVVIRRRSGDRLLVAVQFLQKGASVEIAGFQLERID
ncbi:MAG TPA: transcription termination/antitermination NusG family protein [Thermoguttaceae bacterium]|nr:transcription termination/antitermination NusG family protein [Thermoguttaceae bacterium]